MLTVSLIIIDQLSKFLFERHFQALVSYNTGVAFGIPIPWFVSFTIGVLALAFIYYLKRIENLRITWYLQLFIAGTIGNMIDRIWHNHVIDFINIGFWPSFNLADSYLTIAVIYIVFYHLKVD